MQIDTFWWAPLDINNSRIVSCKINNSEPNTPLIFLFKYAFKNVVILNRMEKYSVLNIYEMEKSSFEK